MTHDSRLTTQTHDFSTLLILREERNFVTADRRHARSSHRSRHLHREHFMTTQAERGHAFRGLHSRRRSVHHPQSLGCRIRAAPRATRLQGARHHQRRTRVFARETRWRRQPGRTAAARARNRRRLRPPRQRRHGIGLRRIARRRGRVVSPRGRHGSGRRIDRRRDRRRRPAPFARSAKRRNGLVRPLKSCTRCRSRSC